MPSGNRLDGLAAPHFPTGVNFVACKDSNKRKHFPEREKNRQLRREIHGGVCSPIQQSFVVRPDFS